MGSKIADTWHGIIGAERLGIHIEGKHDQHSVCATNYISIGKLKLGIRTFQSSLSHVFK